jgi:diguanylate cyclase (GGDEF)-like protein
MYGVSRASFVVRPYSLWDFDHPDDVAAVTRAIEAARRDRTLYEIEHRIVRPDGTERWVVERGRYSYDDAGTPIAIAGTVLDTTERKRAEERATHLVHHDALTGLPNRIVLAEALQRAVGAAGRRGTRVAVLCIDMDRFTRINDTLGHVAGDAVLKALAERVRGCLGPGDLLSRTAGDAFFAVLPDIERIEDAARIAERIVSAVAHPSEVFGRALIVTACIGASVYPDDGLGPDQLMRNAEAAMYRAKREGRGAIAFAEPELHAQARKRLLIEHELRDAVAKNELRLHYQPLVDAETGTIVGCEALIRWQHPSHGMLHPDTFIGLAEESGLITSIGTWVIEEACKTVCRWANIAQPFTLAVNISARQLQHGELVETIDRLMRRHGCPPESVEMEITETTAMRDAERALRVLGEIKTRSIKIGIDDFGTGYSSLAYLKRFPLDKLKIDRSFVSDLTSQNGRSIVAAIISLAHSLGLVAVAEGVETEEQRAMLSDLRCDQMQGYLFSPPLPAETFETLLRTGKRYA